MTFLEFMEMKIGPKWVVLPRRTEKLLQKYSDKIAITRKRFNELKREYQQKYTY